MAGITLQSVLDYSSQLLGESGGTPSSQTTIRTNFANRAKNALARIRNWSWELQDGDPINYVYSATPTNGEYTYTLTPSAGTFKNKDSMVTLIFTDSNKNQTAFSQAPESQVAYEVLNQLTDNIFFIKGNDNSGYTLVVNSYAMGLPASNVSNAWSYRYFAKEADFVATTDTSSIPDISYLAWKVAEDVLYGYREQAQAQLAGQSAQNALDDMAMQDQKEAPYVNQSIMSFRTFVGASNSFKSYY